MLEILDRLDRLERRIQRALPAPPSGSDSSDLLARFAARYRDDYLGFTRLLDVKGLRGRVPFRLTPIQQEYDAARSPRDVVLKSRRVGMTTEGVARDVWHLLTQPNASVTIVCQSISEHKPVYTIRGMIDVFLQSLRDRGLHLEFATNQLMKIQLVGGGQLDIVEAGASKDAASKKGRADRISRLHATEVSFWEYAGETLNAMLDCVPARELGSEIEIESTANGAGAEDRGDPKAATGSAYFHWKCIDARAGKGEWKFHFWPWWRDPECSAPLHPGEVVEPRTDRERTLVGKGITPEQLKYYHRKLEEKNSQEVVDQEFPSDPDTCFLVSGRTFFNKEKLAELLNRSQDPVAVQTIRESGVTGQIIGREEVPALRVWHNPEPKRQYVVSADTSEGTGGDPSAAVVLERGTGRHMATLWGQFKPFELARWLKLLATKYNGAVIVVERNKDGGTVLVGLETQHRYDRVWRAPDGKAGFMTIANDPAGHPGNARAGASHGSLRHARPLPALRNAHFHRQQARQAGGSGGRPR